MDLFDYADEREGIIDAPAESRPPSTEEAEIITNIRQRRRQFLVHSFLYYEMDENIVSDLQYDAWSRELIDLQDRYPDLAAKVEFHDLCMQLDAGVSGYYLKGHYPPSIKTTAIQLISIQKKQPLKAIAQGFGYRVDK